MTPPSVVLLATLHPYSVSLAPPLTTHPTSTLDDSTRYACYTASFAAGEATFYHHQTPTERRAFYDDLRSTDPSSLALLDGETLLGFSYVLYSLPPNCHLSCLCLHPRAQGQGLGTALLRLTINAALEVGYQTMTLRTERDTAAHRLYLRHGFHQVSAG